MTASGPEGDLTRDAFLGGRLSILQPRHGYRAATDPVLLAAAVPARPGQSVLELGCGAGVALLCLAKRVPPGLRLVALELQPDYAALARRNAAENGVEVQVLEGDVAAPPRALRGQAFDHVLANPPWYPPGGGTQAADAGRETALREAAAVPLAAWVDCAVRRLRPGGRLTIIQQTARLAGLLAALDRRMGSVALRPLSARPGREAGRILLQARKGGRGALRLLAPLVLHAGSHHLRDGEGFSPEADAILRAAAALDL